MRLNVGVLSAAVVVLTCAPFSIAGPLFPCPTAVNSVHGNAIAIARKTIEWHAGIGKLLSVQFTVMMKTDFVNESQKTSAPVTYWGDWPWAVVLDMNNQADRIFYSCAVPLVTDDAQFLILLATGPVLDSALRVYHKGDYSTERIQDGTVKGVLVRDIKLEELWPATKIDSSRIWTDHTPEWFAGGSFDFAPEIPFRPPDLQLIHKTRWGNTVRINLRDGKVLKGTQPSDSVPEEFFFQVFPQGVPINNRIDGVDDDGQNNAAFKI
jgi:hypothetical protein